MGQEIKGTETCGYFPDDWPRYKTAHCTLDNGTSTQAQAYTCTPPLLLINYTPRYQVHV